MKKSLLIIGSLVILVLILSVVQMTISTNLATRGVTLGEIEDQIRSYKTENALIKEQVLEKASYTHIASASADLGFSDKKSYVYLNTPLPIALNR